MDKILPCRLDWEGLIFVPLEDMQSFFAKEIPAARKPKIRFTELGARDQFRTRFKHALSGCLHKGFLLEECFGVIWEETLEEISLSEKAQSTLYAELLEWVKTHPK